jgi:hypothetical protein
MDPLTLFALANGAVQAVKKGCQLYKDIKSATGDVKAVIKDLDDQFHRKYPNPTSTQVKALAEEKVKIKELNKRSEETTNIYTEIGDYLGQYYDNYFKCLAVLEQEEKRSKTEVYTGDASLAKRALQRVLMRKQLEQMGTELRELMIYQSPPELGALFTDVEAMMKIMGKEQKVLIAQQMQKEALREKRRRERIEKYQIEFIIGISVLISILFMIGFFMWLAQDAQKRWGSSTEARDRLQRVRREEWFERQRTMQEYELFLERKQNSNND